MTASDSVRPTILVSSDSMGQGNIDDVGRVLAIEMFIALNQPELTDEEKKAYNITEPQRLPETIIFYNSGVNFTLKDSPVLDQLEMLEEKGIDLFIDSVSFDAYAGDKDDQPAVGEVVDTYIIQSLILHKRHIITF